VASHAKRRIQTQAVQEVTADEEQGIAPAVVTEDARRQMKDEIKKNAELVIAQMNKLSGFDFGYDGRSVAWLDGYIERQRAREDITEELIDGLVGVFGSYLGECVIACHGGHWENEAGQWRVNFDDRNAVCPFAKVRKQFQNGPEDSIKSFFEGIPTLFAPALGKGDSKRKPRWKFW
jgi:hypothetical protein